MLVLNRKECEAEECEASFHSVQAETITLSEIGNSEYHALITDQVVLMSRNVHSEMVANAESTTRISPRPPFSSHDYNHADENGGLGEIFIYFAI